VARAGVVVVGAVAVEVAAAELLELVVVVAVLEEVAAFAPDAGHAEGATPRPRRCGRC
jgi:hypothetical protein